MKMLHRFLPAFVLIAALLIQPGEAALPAYMSLTGENQGEIRGGVTLPGRENSIEVISLEHQVISPRDPASGQATGRRQHGALKITKEIDKSTPLLYNVLVTKENLTNVTIRFYKTDRNGAERQYYTIKLINASVSSVRVWKPNTKDAEAVKFPDMEEIQFTYQRIIWTFEDGNIQAEDSTTAVNE